METGGGREAGRGWGGDPGCNCGSSICFCSCLCQRRLLTSKRAGGCGKDPAFPPFLTVPQQQENLFLKLPFGITCRRHSGLLMANEQMICLAIGMVPRGYQGRGGTICWEEAQNSGTLEHTRAAAKEAAYCLILHWPPSRANGSGVPSRIHGGWLSSVIPGETHPA